MSKRRGGRGSKYTDEFKRRLVAESHGDGVSVLMVSRRHA
ncbi:transposase [Paracoccaceae bacterium]|nr:transposase [Paracoccaceae bacterium]